MDNEQIKETLLSLEDCEMDFTVIMTGKESSRVNGLYKPDTREILLHNKNFKTDNELLYTAIHEYAHHLINVEEIQEKGEKLAKKGGRVHDQAFWVKFHTLIEIAEQKGIYKLDIEISPELKELTDKIRKDYIEVNGQLMAEFGRLLSKAHTLCEAANIRYEDYLDRVLKLPRTTAQEITKVGLSDVNPAVGFENMKKISTIKKDEDRRSAEQQILESDKPADTVRELMKKKAAAKDPRERLEKEKNRLEKTIAALQQRLALVEEGLESLE